MKLVMLILASTLFSGCATAYTAGSVYYNRGSYNSSMFRASGTQELLNFTRALGGQPNAQNLSFLYQVLR